MIKRLTKILDDSFDAGMGASTPGFALTTLRSSHARQGDRVYQYQESELTLVKEALERVHCHALPYLDELVREMARCRAMPR